MASINTLPIHNARQRRNELSIRVNWQRHNKTKHQPKGWCFVLSFTYKIAVISQSKNTVLKPCLFLIWEVRHNFFDVLAVLAFFFSSPPSSFSCWRSLFLFTSLVRAHVRIYYIMYSSLLVERNNVPYITIKNLTYSNNYFH